MASTTRWMILGGAIAAPLLAGLFAGCTGGVEGAGGAGGGSSGAGAGGPSGLPCDVEAVLAEHCTACHTSPPKGGAPVPLLTYEDLAATSPNDPSKTEAVLALERMKSTDPKAVMPPGGGVPADAIAAFEAWVNAGAPRGDCGEVDAGTPDPVFAGPTVCTSMTQGLDTSDVSDSQRPFMYPGKPCVKCHSTDPEAKWEAPMAIGGTVYATGHEPDLCNGADTTQDVEQAVVVVTDKNGLETTLKVNKVGNFYKLGKPSSVAFPITAKVVYQGKERKMLTPQDSGDCNLCHSEKGDQGAPGRVALP